MKLELPPYTDEHDGIVYPSSDGRRIAENTKQFRYIMTLHGGIDALFADDEAVFVAGNLLWYPVEGEPTTRRAPDVMVAFGRPKGDRQSYMQWLEGGVAPQVVFEVFSPGNTHREMLQKFAFYTTYGVEEYYIYDPNKGEFDAWVRGGAGLEAVAALEGWASPRLGVRFELRGGELDVLRPDGQPFLTYVALQKREHLRWQAAEQAQQAADRYAARLRSLGIDPATVTDEETP